MFAWMGIEIDSPPQPVLDVEDRPGFVLGVVYFGAIAPAPVDLDPRSRKNLA
jgi:hypothetical protein